MEEPDAGRGGAEADAHASEEQESAAVQRIAREVVDTFDQQARPVVRSLTGHLREQERHLRTAKAARDDWMMDEAELQERLKELQAEMDALQEEIEQTTAKRATEDNHDLSIIGHLKPVRLNQKHKRGDSIGDIEISSADGDGIDDVQLDVHVSICHQFVVYAKRQAARMIPFHEDLNMIRSRYGNACCSFFSLYRFLIYQMFFQLLVFLPLFVMRDYGNLSSSCGSIFPCFILYGAIRESDGGGRTPRLVFSYAAGLIASALGVFALALYRWGGIDRIFQREQLQEKVNPRKWSRLVVAQWDFSLATEEDRQNWSQETKILFLALLDDEAELAVASSRTWNDKMVLRLRRLVGAMMNLCLILFAWAFIVYATVFREDLPTAYFAKLLGGSGGPLGTLAIVLSEAAPNIALRIIGAVLPVTTKAITYLEGWRPSVRNQHVVWRLLLGKLLNVIIVIVVNVELVAGRPLYGQDEQLLKRDNGYSCVEDQAAAAFLSLVLSELLLTNFLKPIVNLYAYRLWHRLKRLFGYDEIFQKPEFLIPEHAVELLDFQCYIWASSILAPTVLLVVPFMHLAVFKWRKFELIHLSSKPMTDERSAMALTLLSLSCLTCLMYAFLVFAFLLQLLPHDAACGPFGSDASPLGAVVAGLASVWPAVGNALQVGLDVVTRTAAVQFVLPAAAALVALPTWIRSRAHEVAMERLQNAFTVQAALLDGEVERMRRKGEVIGKRLWWYTERQKKSHAH